MMTNKEYKDWMKEKKDSLLNKKKPLIDINYNVQTKNKINEDIDNIDRTPYIHQDDYRKLDKDIAKYCNLLARIVSEYSLYKEAEEIVKIILYYKTELEYINLNEEESVDNFPAIDLISPFGDYAYQVTIQKDDEDGKVAHTKELTLDYKNHEKTTKKLTRRYAKYFEKLEEVKVIFFSLEVKNPTINLYIPLFKY